MWTPPGYPVDASIALPSHSGCQSEPCNGLNASRSRAEKRSISLESARFLERSISRRPRLASLVESPVAFNDLRAPHPRRAALVRVTLSSRPSMSLNFRASSTRNTLHDADVRNTLHDDDDVDDVNSDVQVHKPSRSCRKEVSRCRLTALCACAGSRDSPPDVTSRRRRG